MVGVTGFEPAASCSQSRRATNCATPRFFYFAFFLIFSVLPCFVRPLAKLSPMALLCNAMRSVLLRFLRLPASATGSGRLRHPKQARYQLRYTPIFLFCFFLNIFRASLLCPPSCKIVAHGTAMQRHALCFAALPQAPCICHRQRSPSSPKAGALPTALHPDFLFCFFLKIFRASLLCPPAIRLAQAHHGTCVILIYPARFVKRVIGWATVAAPSALMHTQRKIPPLWLTPGRWYSLGAKISPGTAGWTGSGHRYPAARLRWSCLRSPGAWPAARPPKRLHRS